VKLPILMKVAVVTIPGGEVDKMTGDEVDNSAVELVALRNCGYLVGAGNEEQEVMFW
jgi:hypothetical protein